MSSDAGGDLRFHIDRLVVSGRRVFGWGWIADGNRTIRDLHLRLEGDGWDKRLSASIGLARSDVAQALPDLVAAGSSGFVVTGYVPASSARQLSLEVGFDDGSAATIDVGNFVEVSEIARESSRRTFARLVRAAWWRLKAADFTGLLRRQGGRRFAVASIDDAKGREALMRPLRAARSVRIIFDHNMGGGANQYRCHQIEQWVAASEVVVLCTYNLPTLDYRFHLFVPGQQDREFRASSFLVLEAALQSAPVAELFVNSPVSFDEPILFAGWLARMRREHATTRITVTAHDFFAVCPSFVLLNAEGRYCGIPEIRECESCLRRHEGAHVAFSPPSQMAPWREAWGGCLAAADEVRCFSESTRTLLTRAYPWLARATTTLVPHSLDFPPGRLPKICHTAPLVIGVMGKISLQKGALVVTDMLHRIEAQYPDVRIVVLGTFEVPLKSGRLKVTGTYKREELPGLIEAHGINLFLFPSIWPETFSYVVTEMMALQVPIVAFDLGAPAERLRGYRLGRLCRDVSADTALETLLAFHHELAMGEAEAA